MTAKLIVTVFGVALIVLVNLYFFFTKRRETAVSVQEGGVQEIKITVKGGYDPDVLIVKKGAPVRLNFYRDETADCSDTIVSVISIYGNRCPPIRQRRSSSLLRKKENMFSPAGWGC